ncbi:MAG: hypothetical protein ACOYN0_16350 [Phycisphaerales bacterium]
MSSMSDDGTFEMVDPNPGVPRGIPGKVRVCEDVYATLDAAAAELFLAAGAAADQRGAFHLGVSATPLTLRLLRQVLIDPTVRSFPWKQTNVWMTENSGADDLRELLLDHSGIASKNLHVLDSGDDRLDQAGEQQFKEVLLAGPASAGLDAVLLGLDGGWARLKHAESQDGIYLARDGAVWLHERFVTGAARLFLLGSGPEAFKVAAGAAAVARGEPGVGLKSDLVHLAAERSRWFLGADGETTL